MKYPYKNCAILILSCDKYADIWEPFFSQFYKYWPDCPFKVYLGSNSVKLKNPRVETILSKISEDWSSDLLKILNNIKEEYVFVWMEDLFPVEKIDSKLFVRAFQFMEKNKGNHIQMSPYFPPVGNTSDKLFGYYNKRMPYRINAPGFWNKPHLQQLLIPGENPWNFEIMGSYRARYYNGYYCINRPLFRFIRIIEKGMIRRRAYQYCLKNEIKLDIKRRQIHSVYQQVLSDAGEYLFNIIVRIPWNIRLGLMDILRRAVVSY